MQLPARAVDVSTYFWLDTSPNVTDLDLYYAKDGAAMSSKVDATALAAADSAHSDNKAYALGHGLYRIDWPDAAFTGRAGSRVRLLVVFDPVNDFSERIDVELTAPYFQTSIESVVVPDTSFVLSRSGLDADDATHDDAYNYMVVSVEDITGGTVETRRALDYAGATKRLTVDRDFSFPLDVGDIVRIYFDAYTTTAVGGAVDWTDTEKEQMRYRFGIDGEQSRPVTAKPRMPWGGRYVF